MNGKKSFVLYCDLIHTVEQLPDDKAGLLFKHLLKYVNDENPISDDLIVNVSFEPIKQQLKRDLQVWLGIKEDRSIAGKKGGLASGIARSKQTKQVLQKRSKTKQNEANEAVTVTVNDTVTVTVKKDIKDTWNYFASNYNLAQIKALSKTRISHINQRLKDKDFDLVEVLRMAEKSDFLKGSTGWKMTFDWVIGSPNNFIKILEGNYNNEKSSGISEARKQELREIEKQIWENANE